MKGLVTNCNVLKCAGWTYFLRKALEHDTSNDMYVSLTDLGAGKKILKTSTTKASRYRPRKKEVKIKVISPLYSGQSHIDRW